MTDLLSIHDPVSAYSYFLKLIVHVESGHGSLSNSVDSLKFAKLSKYVCARRMLLANIVVKFVLYTRKQTLLNKDDLTKRC